MKNLSKLLIQFSPLAIILGIFDYRFSQTFFPNLSNHFQIFTQGYFDHTSILTIFSLLLTLTLIPQLFTNTSFRHQTTHIFKKTLIFLIPLLTALGLTYTLTSQLTPIIRSKNQIIFLFWLLPLTTTLLSISYIKTHNINLHKSLKLSIAIFITLILTQKFTHIFPGQTLNHLQRLTWPYLDPFNPNNPASPNLLAYILAPATLYLIFQTYTSAQNKSNNLILLTLTAFTLILTQSYTAILSLLAISVLFLFKQTPSKHKPKLIISSIVILTVLILTQYNTPKFQILLGNTTTSNSLTERTKIYQVSTQLISQHPLKGLGPNNYQTLFKQQQTQILQAPLIEREVPPHPHNLILHFWNELGILGLLTILILYLQTIITTLTTKKLQLPTAITLYFCVHGLADVPLFLEEHFYLFLPALLLLFINSSKLKKTLSSN